MPAHLASSPMSIKTEKIHRIYLWLYIGYNRTFNNVEYLTDDAGESIPYHYMLVDPPREWPVVLTGVVYYTVSDMVSQKAWSHMQSVQSYASNNF